LLVVGIAILIGAGITAYILLRGREREVPQIPPRPAHEIAYEQLKELKRMDLPGQGRIKEYYTILSDIIRHYLENRFLLRAPEMTTEEFIQEAGRSPKIGAEQKKLLKEFLSHCDMVKFAKYGPTLLEMLDSYREAENFIDQTRLVEKEISG